MVDWIKVGISILVVAASIWLYYDFAQEWLQIARVGLVIVAVLIAFGILYTTSGGANAWQFVRGANIERRKVIWPTPKETMQVTLMVILFTILLGLLIWLFDWFSFKSVYNWVLGVRI